MTGGGASEGKLRSRVSIMMRNTDGRNKAANDKP